MTPEEIRHLTSIYNNHPDYFDAEQTDALAEQAQSVGAPMERDPHYDDFNMLRVAGQMVDGVIKGGVGIFDPEIGGKPRNSVEEIAKSVGELGGFVGSFFLPVGWVLKGVGAGAHAVGATRMALRAIEFADKLAVVKSVPIMAGEAMLKKLGPESATAVANAFGKTLGKTIGEEAAMGIGRQAFAGGVRMGVAGAVSSVDIGDGRTLGESVRDAVSAGFYGATFGSAMDVIPGQLGALKWMTEHTTAAQFIKSAAGSVVNALPAAIGGADPYRVGYEAAVGAVFGRQALTWKEFGFHEIQSGVGKDWGAHLQSNGDFQRFFKDRPEAAKEYLNFHEKLHGVKPTQEVWGALSKAWAEFNGHDTSGMNAAQINRLNNGGYGKFDVGQQIMQQGTGTAIKVTEVHRGALGEITHYSGIDPATLTTKKFSVSESLEFRPPQAEPVSNVEPEQVAQKAPVSEAKAQADIVLPTEIKPSGEAPTHVSEAPIEVPRVEMVKAEPLPETTKNVRPSVAQEDTDYDPGVMSLSGFNRSFRKFAMQLHGFPKGARESEIHGATVNLFHEMVRVADMMRAKDPTSRGMDDFMDYLHIFNKDIKPKDLHELMPTWATLTQNIVVDHSSYGQDKVLVPFSLAKGGSMGMSNGNAVDMRLSPSIFELIGGDDAREVITGYERKSKKDSRVKEHVAFSEANLTVDDFNLINTQLGTRDRFLFSAGADKAMFIGLKFIDGHMTPAERHDFYVNHQAEMEAVMPGYTRDMETDKVDSKYDPDVYERVIVNNILYYEKMNGLTFGDAMADPRMIRKVTDFNKRIQPLMTNFYKMDKQLMSHFGGDKLNWNAIIVRDADFYGGNVEDTDGSTTSHSKFLKMMANVMGVPNNESHLKSFINHMEKGVGMLIGKHGQQRAAPEMDRAMEAAGIGHIIRVSGAKQIGKRTVYRMRHTKDGLLEFSLGDKHTDPFVPVDYKDLNKTLLNVDSFNISSSIHDNIQKSINHAVTFPKQGLYHMSTYETGVAATKALMDWVVGKFKGDAEMNAKLEKFVTDGADKRGVGDLDHLMENFDKLGVEKVLDAMITDKDGGLRAKIIQKMVGAYSEEAMMNDGEGIDSIPEGLEGIKRMIAVLAHEEIIYSREGRKITDAVIARYVTHRLTHPKVRAAGHGTMHGYTEDLVRHINGKEFDQHAYDARRERVGDRLTQENMFLDNGYKEMELEKGVVFEKGADGKYAKTIKRGKVTLEEQFNSFERIEKQYERAMNANGRDESAIDQTIAKTYHEMEEALHFAVTRVPMDSFSGTVRLRFAGFTGMEGGGILLHGEIKKQLGGADNDGDTAYFYHGLPKEYLQSLYDARGNFDKYANVLVKRSNGQMIGKEPSEAKIFFTDVEGLKFKDSVVGMLSPIHRLSVGHAVSKGRGKMLPIAVKYVDVMKKLLDTAYGKGGTLELNGGEKGYTLTLHARDYTIDANGKLTGTGETLGAYGQRAINSAADAGKEAGMVSEDQMRAILMASAFDKIMVGDKVLFDIKDGDFNKANHAERLAELAKYLSEDGLNLNEGFKLPKKIVTLKDTPIGAYNKLLTRMFGYNTRENQPWALDEVSDAAGDKRLWKDGKPVFETPYNYITPFLRDTKYRDGLLDRLMPIPQRNRFMKMLKSVGEWTGSNAEGGGAWWSDGILNGGVSVEYKKFQTHFNLHAKYYDPNNLERVGNFATLKGREYFAQSGNFEKYLDTRLGIYGERKMEATDRFDKEGDPIMKRAKHGNHDLISLQKEFGFFWDKQGNVSPKNIEARAKFLAGERLQLQDYASSRINDIASAIFTFRQAGRLGITKRDAGIRASFNEVGESAMKYLADPKYKPTLIDLVKLVKYSQEMFHRREWSDGKDVFGNSLVFSKEQAQQYALDVDAHIYRITEQINANRKPDAPKVTPRQVGDLYHTMMVSTLLKGSDKRTGTLRWGLDTVPDRIIAEYARMIGEVYDGSQKQDKDINWKEMWNAFDKAEARHEPMRVEPAEHVEPVVEKPVAKVPEPEMDAPTPSDDNLPEFNPDFDENYDPSFPIEEHPPSPVTERVEKKAVEEPKDDAKVGAKLVEYFNLALNDVNLDTINETLSPKQKEQFKTIFEFMQKRHAQLGTDMRKFFAMANELVPNGHNNPNQWTQADLKGLVSQLKKQNNVGTLLQMAFDMTHKAGDPDRPRVGVATWLSFPITNAMRLMADPVAWRLKHEKIFGKDGLLRPDASEKAYQDDEGKLREVFMEGWRPMNALHSNLNRHTSLDAVQTEINKKVEALYTKFFTWYAGGVHGTDGVDYTKAIERRAVEEHQRDGYLRMNDHENADQHIRRMYEDDANAPVGSKWADIEQKEMSILEGGSTKAVTGAEAVKRMRESIEGLGKEYQKFVKLADTELGDLFVTKKDLVSGSTVIDLHETSSKFKGLLDTQMVGDKIPSYDANNLFHYFLNLEGIVTGKLREPFKRYTALEVQRLEAYDGKDKMHGMLPMIATIHDAKQYIKMYRAEMFKAEGVETTAPIEGKAKTLYDEAKRRAVIDRAIRKQIQDGVPDVKRTEHMDVMGALAQYVGSRVDASDVRVRLFGMIPNRDAEGNLYYRYSQYEQDVKMHRSVDSMSEREYYTSRLMDKHRFRETDLLDGWFPHRDFDKGVLTKFLEAQTEKARTKEWNGESDVRHFEKIQETVRALMQEQRDPGSIDDGKLHDALLSSNGYIPMEYVTSSSPQALKTRTTNFDGYSTEPIQMQKAIMSVVRSGNAKVVAALNNDEIVKFENAHIRAHQEANLKAGRPIDFGAKENEDYYRPWVQYMRQVERQAFNRPSVYTNEMLNDPLVKIKWTPAYWFSDHVMLTKKWSRMNKWYREMTKADLVTDMDKVIYKRENGVEMSAAEELKRRDERSARFLDFSTNEKGEFTSQALKNMENASRMFKNFSMFEGKMEMASLLFHTRFAVNNIYGGTINDYIHNGFSPLRKGRDMKYWNSINSEWRTMADVDRFFETAGVIESVIMKDIGYTGNKSQSAMDTITEKSSYFLRKTEPWLRREAAKHGYIAAREAMSGMGNIDYNNPHLLSMARKSVEASQFLYNNHNRPAFMASNMGKVYMRFKLWGMNSLKMQGDIMNAAAGAGFKKGSIEAERYQRMMTANMFMFGLALMFPHTIFQSQLPQPIDQMATLSGVFFGDDEENKKKRKNLMKHNVDPIRDVIGMLTQVPGASFPLTRVPLALYDIPSFYRAIWSHDVHDMATATTLNILPFGRMTKDVINAYGSPSMAAELLAGIPLHRVDNFFTKNKKKRMMQDAIEAMKDNEPLPDDEVEQFMRAR